MKNLKLFLAAPMLAVLMQAEVHAATYPIVDSAQTKTYNATAEIAAPVLGQPFYGQDAQFSGTQPSYTLSLDGKTVVDNVTKLTWMRGPNTTLTTPVKADKKTLSQAQAWVATVNAMNYGGFSDWRLPAIKELYSLMNFKGTDPSSFSGTDTSVLTPFIDTTYFKFGYGQTSLGERVIDSQYASSNIFVVNPAETGYPKLFGLNLADGRIKGYDLIMPDRVSEKTFFVQLVRGGSGYGANSFTDLGDGTVTDAATGLMWTKGDNGAGITWEDALALVQARNGANYLGHSDWRLPNAKELNSLVNYANAPDFNGRPAIDTTFFTCTAITNENGDADFPYYWTSTTHAGYSPTGSPGSEAVYIPFGRALGWPGSGWVDVHGAGAQRSDPKIGPPYSFATTHVISKNGKTTTGYSHGPQGDAVRGLNFVRLVRDVATSVAGSTIRNALFVNASSSPNKTSVLRLVNPGTAAGALTATAYNETGSVVGTPGASLGNIGAQQMATFSSAQLEAAIGYVPSSPTAKFRIVLTAALPSFEVVNFVRDVASGNLTLGQAQTDKALVNSAGFSSHSTRTALFVSASTSANKTSVIRLINLGSTTGTVTAIARDESGTVVGNANASLGALSAGQMLTFTSLQLESAIGYIPASPAAKYSITFSTALPGFEMLNFVKDIASGNLTLGQAQTYDRGTGTASAVTRNALVVNPSSSAAGSVLRLVNTSGQSGTVTATAYSEAGSTVGTVNAALGTFADGQVLAFTSAQLESMIGYAPSSSDARHRIVFTANLPDFELINFVKDKASGNLVLAQAQIDDRADGTASATSRSAIFLNASTSASKTSIVRLINPGNQSGALTATAYDEAGKMVGAVNATLASLGAQQISTFTSAQLEAAIGYAPSSPTAKYRIVFNAALPNFEIVNEIADVATGNVTLGQAQVD
jgi:hypothetical protein